MEQQYKRTYFWKKTPKLQFQKAPDETEVIQYKSSEEDDVIYYDAPKAPVKPVIIESSFVFESAIRKQQRFYFSLLRKVIEQDLGELDKMPHYYRLDIPVWNGERFETVRYFRILDTQQIIYLKTSDQYHGQPLRPTLGYRNDSDKYPFLESPISDPMSHKALLAYYKEPGRTSFLFSDKSIEFLKLALEYAHIDNKTEKKNEMLNRMGIKSAGYDSRKKVISEKIKKELGVSFSDYTLVAQYWIDMGMSYPHT